MLILDSWTGATVQVTCGDDWQKLATLVGGNPKDIFQDDHRADGVLLTVATYAANMAFGDEKPGITGHALSVGDAFKTNIRMSLSRLWVKNGTAGQNSVLTVTPLFNG